MILAGALLNPESDSKGLISTSAWSDSRWCPTEPRERFEGCKIQHQLGVIPAGDLLNLERNSKGLNS